MSCPEALFLRDIVEHLDHVYWQCDVPCTRMYYVTSSYERMYGRSQAALYADALDWLHAVHPDDVERVKRCLQELDATELRGRYRIIRPDGEVRTIDYRLVPQTAEDGSRRMTGVAQDVTESVQLHEQVVQTQRLEALALLAGGVAHDFNNILAVIAANASMLEMSAVQGSEDQELTAEITTAVRRGTMVTRQLLAFSRKQMVEPVVTDLNYAVSDALKLLRRVVGEDVMLVTSLEPELSHIKIDPTSLVQVLMNLVVNARDAMPTGGRLTIETRNDVETNSVHLTVRDTGTGMKPEVMKRALEPLFTTKPPGKGTGLGLSVVDGIVKQAGGRLTLESTVGVGTLVRIELPSDAGPAVVKAQDVTGDVAGTETVVVVDDDDYVRRSVARSLRKHGYQVLEASDGPTALALLDKLGRRVDILVTDVVMPVMNGRELVETARQRRPSLPALYMSGYIDDALMRHGVVAEMPLLEKPFRMNCLAAKVRLVLDSRS